MSDEEQASSNDETAEADQLSEPDESQDELAQVWISNAELSPFRKPRAVSMLYKADILPPKAKKQMRRKPD